MTFKNLTSLLLVLTGLLNSCAPKNDPELIRPLELTADEFDNWFNSIIKSYDSGEGIGAFQSEFYCSEGQENLSKNGALTVTESLDGNKIVSLNTSSQTFEHWKSEAAQHEFLHEALLTIEENDGYVMLPVFLIQTYTEYDAAMFEEPYVREILYLVLLQEFYNKYCAK